MPTQIIDGFKLNASTPIDSRLVTTGTASRNTMTYKYDGLRVYDTIQKKPFVYINGDWIEESGGVTTTTTTTTTGVKIDGTPNYIPKIISTGTTSSNIREYVTGNERRIGINIPESTQIATTLHVGGTVTAANFVGTVAVTNIVGILPLSKITNANDPAKTYVLKSINSTNTWILETIGSTIKIDKDTNSEKLFFAFTTDKDITGNSLYIVNNGTNDLLAANAKTRQLMVGTSNNHTNPQYSFVAKLGTGMYGTNTEVGLSIEGKKSLYITSTMVGINLNGVTTMKFEPTLTTISNPTTITGTTTINGATTITGNTKITGKLEVTDTFKYTKSPASGNVLTSDASGNALWTNAISIGIGLPYGSIIVWPFDVASIPSDFKVCNGVGFIFINDSYKAIPDLRDRNITGSSDMTTVSAYGVSSPSTPQTVTLAVTNLPRHKHAVSTTNYSTANSAINPTEKVTATSTFTGNALGPHSHTISSNVQFDGGGGGDSYRNIANTDYPDKYTSSVSAGTPSGSVTTTLSGYTDDGTTKHGNIGIPFNIPHSKGWKLILLIKINTNAEIYRSGHYSLNDLGGVG